MDLVSLVILFLLGGRFPRPLPAHRTHRLVQAGKDFLERIHCKSAFFANQKTEDPSLPIGTTGRKLGLQ